MSAAEKILIVEDEPVVALGMETTLTANGYEVLGPCRTVDAAFNEIRLHKPDQAILDIKLADGETCEPISDYLQAAKVPIIFSSVFSEAHNLLLRKYPDAHHFTKPHDPMDLLAVLDHTYSAPHPLT